MASRRRACRGGGHAEPRFLSTLADAERTQIVPFGADRLAPSRPAGAATLLGLKPATLESRIKTLGSSAPLRVASSDRLEPLRYIGRLLRSPRKSHNSIMGTSEFERAETRRAIRRAGWIWRCRVYAEAVGAGSPGRPNQ